MVERSLSMREVRGSIPRISKYSGYTIMKSPVNGLLYILFTNIDDCHGKDLVSLPIAERSFDLRTSGLWAQHASAAPLCSTVTFLYHCL